MMLTNDKFLPEQNILPEICLLRNYLPEKYSGTFLGEIVSQNSNYPPENQTTKIITVVYVVYVVLTAR